RIHKGCALLRAAGAFNAHPGLESANVSRLRVGGLNDEKIAGVIAAGHESACVKIVVEEWYRNVLDWIVSKRVLADVESSLHAVLRRLRSRSAIDHIDGLLRRRIRTVAKPQQICDEIAASGVGDTFQFDSVQTGRI